MIYIILIFTKTYLTMKKILILTLLLTSMLKAQISEVKVEGSYAKIYNDVGRYTGNSIYLGVSNSLQGYNSKYIVIKEGSYVKIYNDIGRYTSNSIYLGTSNYIKNVSGGAILVKEGNYVKYYNFQGRYTGNSTYDSK